MVNIKKVFSALGTLLLFLFILLVFIVLLPLMIVMLVVWSFVSVYDRLWQRLRNDPKADISIPELEKLRAEGSHNYTKEGIINSFNAVSAVLSKYSGAHEGKLTLKGFEHFDKQPLKVDWATVGLSKTLTSSKATVKLSQEFKVSMRDGGELCIVELGSDECCEDIVSSIEVQITRPRPQNKKSFYLVSSGDAWMLIGFLRGSIKYIGKGSQQWVYLPEHNVWLVKYKTDRAGYGLRATYKNVLAQKYGHDKFVL